MDTTVPNPSTDTLQVTDDMLEKYADTNDSIGYLCRVAFRRFAKALEANTSKFGVSSGQWRFLRVLWEEDGIMQRELSRRVDMREPTTVVALKGLEKNGFITRKRDEFDKRIIRVYLTPKAKSLREVLQPFVVDVNERAIEGLTEEEVVVLKKALVLVADNLAEK